MSSIHPIRPSPISGTWYSSDPTKLALEIDQYITLAKNPEIDGKIIGILAPHAGYQYSGPTAGFAFRTVMNREYDLVIILSPYHAYHSALLLTSAHQMYSTPLGLVSVNLEILRELQIGLSKIDFQLAQVANDREHSLEIEIPFLQRSINGEFQILPLMIRHVTPDDAKIIAKILFDRIRLKKVLIVISSDLSHFYEQSLASRFDMEILNKISTYSLEDVFETEKNGSGFACGLGAILIGMELTRLLGGNEIKILSHSTSGDQTGDYQSVVGYGAAAFIAKSLHEDAEIE